MADVKLNPVPPSQVPSAEVVEQDDTIVGVRLVNGVLRWFKFAWRLLVPSISASGSWVIGGVDTGRPSTGVSLNIASGTYREPGSAKPLHDLPDFSTVPVGSAYVVDDDAVPGQLDLYYKGGGGTTWTIIQNWGGIPGPPGPKGDKGDIGGLGIFAELGADGRVKPSQLPPKPLLLSVPPKLTVTLGNTVRQRIPYALLPEGVAPNIIFQCFDLEAIRFSGDGSFTAKAVGTSEVWVTPTENTDERKVVTVEVVAPSTRVTSTGDRRVTSAGDVRTT